MTATELGATLIAAPPLVSTIAPTDGGGDDGEHRDAGHGRPPREAALTMPLDD